MWSYLKNAYKPSSISSVKKVIAETERLKIRNTTATHISSTKPVPIGPLNFPIIVSINDKSALFVTRKLLVKDVESKSGDTIDVIGISEKAFGYVSIFCGKHRDVKRKPAADALKISQPCPPKACLATTIANTSAITAE